MRFAESNSLVIAAAAQVMALIVVGNRVIALVHLPGSESAGMRCPTAAVLHECTTLVRLYASSWLAANPRTYRGHGLHTLVREQLREQLGVEVAHPDRLCVPGGHRFLELFRTRTFSDLYEKMSGKGASASEAHLDVALNGVRHRVAPAELLIHPQLTVSVGKHSVCTR